MGQEIYQLSSEEVLKKLNSSNNGLSDNEAGIRIQYSGRNELDETKKKTLFSMFIDQFKNIMIIILLVAAGISVLMHETTDAIIIAVVVLINAVLGIVQESKAEKALEALKKMSTPYVKVRRDKQIKQIKTEEIVPGDIVLLEAGDFVPADMRILKSASLRIEEAALTGESVPVEKISSKIVEHGLVIGDRKNMAYSGSSVTYGRGEGVIVSTGMNTEVGKIATHISNSESEETPLQKKLTEMSKYLTVGIVGIAIIIFIVGVLQGRNYFEMFLTAVSLAVAAIPEGLPAVVTIVLAIGVQKMAKRNSIIRKLSAVETLGSTQIICSDKTGTLTQNKMTVKEVYIDGNISIAENVIEESESFNIFIYSLALCNDTKINKKDNNNYDYVGDPTETALVHFASTKGIQKDEIDKEMQRVDEIPFDSERKLMTTINKNNGNYIAITKGAPDVLLKKCTKILMNGEVKVLTKSDIEDIIEGNRLMASRALRVLAVAIKEMDELPQDLISENTEKDMIFVGLVGMIDPSRPEAKDAVKVCIEAGIRPIMITGDHKDTAVAIAKQLGIIKDESQVVTGSELNEISDEEFDKIVTKFSAYARVSPEHKVRIVSAWKKQGKVVAMTGDGVNDAPALKISDIGIGMGITGTDVAKGVSNMVLADDNFATIVVAVEEGRKIYNNIRKGIQFLLSSNLGEVVTLFLATMLNWTILYPIHILWVNLITDSLPALALGVERAEPGIMKQKPRKATSNFFSEGVGISIVYQGTTKGLITLLTYYIGLNLYSHNIAMTMAFATLGLIQLAHSLNSRSNTKSLFSIGVFTNKYLTWAIIISAFLQIIVIVVPFFNHIFRVQQLNLIQWSIVIACSISIIPIVEVIKMLQNMKTKKAG